MGSTLFLRSSVSCFLALSLSSSLFAAETNPDHETPVARTAGPEEITLVFTHPEGKYPVIRPKASLPGARSMDTETTRSLVAAVIDALIAGPTPTEQSRAVYSFLPDGTTLNKLEQPDDTTVKLYLDLPEGFTDSSQYNEYFVHEVGEHFIESLVSLEVSQYYFFVKDSESGEYKPIRDFLNQPDLDLEAVAEIREQKEPDSPSASDTDTGSPRSLPTQNGFVTGALSGKSIVLNQSHGWYDNTGTLQRWAVQRTRTWEVLEDFASATFMNQYVAPLLQNAGARLRPVREMDHQTNMVVVDNAMGSPQYVETGTGWFNSALNGYVHKTKFIGTMDNPFGNASSTRLIRGVTGAATHTATYSANFPATGYYNVYISFAAGTDRTTNAHWQVHHSGGVTDFRINQRNSGATWVLLGNFYFEQNAPASQRKVVALNDNGDTNYLNVDAVRFGGGMGNMERRTHSTSGRPRWQEEAVNYLQYTGMLASSLMSGDDTVTYDDESLGFSNRPQSARWEQTRDGLGNNLIYVGWHTNASGWKCLNGVETSGGGRGTSVHRDVDDDATEGSKNLTTLCYDSFLDSIKLAYNGNWPLRSVPIVASNSYGECNQAHLGSVSGFFFEGLFHDNTTDAAWYKNPRFRYAAARGVVQGVIKYYGGTVFPPEPVSNFRVRNTGSNSVRLDWLAGPVRTASSAYGSAATRYRIFKSTNGYGFDNGVDTPNATPQYTTTLTPGQTTFFRVSAVNAGGISVPSTTLAVRVPLNGAPTVTLVNGYLRNDQFLAPRIAASQIGGCTAPSNTYRTFEPRKFQSFDYSVQHAKAIATKGDYGIDSCTRDAIKAGNVALSNYPMVFWMAGQEGEADTADGVDDTSLNATERTAISSYLQNGGKLFLSGSELVWDLGRSTSPAVERAFVSDYLKLGFVSDNSTVHNAVPTATGIFSGVGTVNFDNGTGTSYAVGFPDVVAPTGGSIAALTYSGGTGGSAGVQYVGTFGSGTQTGKLVYIGFGFETITNENVRNSVMSRVVDFFNDSRVENWQEF